MVVKKHVIEKMGMIAPDGMDRFTRMDPNALSAFYDTIGSEGSFMDRKGDHGVEEDASYKQIIPYLYVVSYDRRFLIYQRNSDPSKYHEERLAGKISLGIGGHVDEGEDIFSCMRREFAEEASVKELGKEIAFKSTDEFMNVLKPAFMGVLDDEKDMVGAVHLGIVFRISLKAGQEVAMRDGESTSFEYLTKDDYSRGRKTGRLVPESWTDMIVQNCLGMVES